MADHYLAEIYLCIRNEREEQTADRCQVSGVGCQEQLKTQRRSLIWTANAATEPSTAHQLRPRWEQQMLLPLATPESEFRLPTLLLDDWMRARGLRASGRP